MGVGVYQLPPLAALEVSGTALETAGDAAVLGGEAGCSDSPMLARRLYIC